MESTSNELGLNEGRGPAGEDHLNFLGYSLALSCMQVLNRGELRIFGDLHGPDSSKSCEETQRRVARGRSDREDFLLRPQEGEQAFDLPQFL